MVVTSEVLHTGFDPGANVSNRNQAVCVGGAYLI